MGALGHYLEEEGIPTTQVSLVREHTAALQPPRALWVPFMLGRPLGVPNDAAFQTRVLLAALRLLECESGPVLEDFPEDAPHVDLGEAPEGLACPVNFPRADGSGSLTEEFADEVLQLEAWHDVALKHRGRTTLGVTGLTTGEIVEFLASWLTGAPRATYYDDWVVAHGVTAYAISRRRTEIAVRIAIGALPGRVITLVLARVWFLVGLGIVAGTGISLWASRFVGGLIYGLSPHEPATLVGAAVLLCAMGTAAAWLPARRAARMDPMIALLVGLGVLAVVIVAIVAASRGRED